MKLVTLKTSEYGQSGAMIGDEVLNFALAVGSDTGSAARWIPASVMEILEAGPEGLAIVERLVKDTEDACDGEKDRLRAIGALNPYDQNQYLAPIPRPRITWSHGGAYPAHREEMARPQGREPDLKKPLHPSGFFKNTNAIIGDGAPIPLPANAPDYVDWEMETSFVIGRKCHNVKKDEAINYVGGHVIMNDVSARDWVPGFQLDKNPERNMALNHFGKQFAGFCPLGPCIATKDEVPNADDYGFSLKVNGELKQQDNVKNAFFSLGELVEYLSHWMTLMPGDIISRGNSSGVGMAEEPRQFLRPGDILEMEADGIGVMRHEIIAAGD